MRNVSSARLLAAIVGCLAIAAASASLADDPPITTQPGQPAGSILDPASAAQPATNTPAAPTAAPQQSLLSQPATPPPASPDARPATNNAKPSDSANSQNTNLKSNTANQSNPVEGSAQRRGDPNNPQGGSLGVNIVSDGGGIFIANVRPGTPAQQMGLQRRDRIESLNGQPVEAVDQFISSIRNMKAGDEVEIGIVRDQAENKVHGKLEAFSQALARGTENMDDERNMSPAGRFSNRMADGSANPNMQTSYEERSGSSGRSSSDLDSRLTALEQQMSELRKEIGALRTAIVSNPSTSALSPGASASPAPLSGALGTPGTRTPGALHQTPGQLPSTR